MKKLTKSHYTPYANNKETHRKCPNYTLQSALKKKKKKCKGAPAAHLQTVLQTP